MRWNNNGSHEKEYLERVENNHVVGNVMCNLEKTYNIYSIFK
jgi:hypothetical protein